MNIERYKADLFRGLIDLDHQRHGADDSFEDLARYKRSPRRFAAEILGSKWWAAQDTVGAAVASHRRVVVRSGNGVGKTHLAADLALWFLCTHRPAIVLVTAPTYRQATRVLWAEIERRYHAARHRLPGRLRKTILDLDGGRSGSFAMPLTADTADAFQGFHCPNMLVILDEASGIRPEIWQAVDGIAVASNNRILAIGNPLSASGPFYEAFRKAGGWHKCTISALDHPNIAAHGRRIPGCVTREIIAERLAEWCEELPATEDNQDASRSAEREDLPSRPHHLITSSPDQITWQGTRYKPTDLFRTRVLGQFPRSEEYGLIPLAWVEAAVSRTLRPEGPRRLAADVARFGPDSTVIGLRQGPVLLDLWALKGADTMSVAGEIERLAFAHHPESIAVDSIGVGAGVVDRLIEQEIDGIEPVNGSASSRDPERYANRRAELYWGLRERFRQGAIAITDDPIMAEELASIRYRINSRGQIQIESKEEMKKRIARSPDRADMLAMLFDSSWDALAMTASRPDVPSAAAILRSQMEGW